MFVHINPEPASAQVSHTKPSLHAVLGKQLATCDLCHLQMLHHLHFAAAAGYEYQRLAHRMLLQYCRAGCPAHVIALLAFSYWSYSPGQA
jgi:hypothetical protein